jgi:outer membrane protein assembly factor BamB
MRTKHRGYVMKTKRTWLLGAALLLNCAALMNSAAVFAQTAETEDSVKGWPKYSFDYANSNNNPLERQISAETAPRLGRAWQTFNDSQWRPGQPPTGFILESAVGLRFPSTVVGVVSPPLIVDGTIYYVDQLGNMFARDAKTGTITDLARHWTTTLVDPDYTANTHPYSPELYYTAPVATADMIWIRSSVNGRVHAVNRIGGQELDFDPAAPGIQPYKILPDVPLSSNLGEPVIVYVSASGHLSANQRQCGARCRVLFISEQNDILQDALIPSDTTEVGVISALDITDPKNVREIWRANTIDLNPATGKPYGSGVSSGSGLAVDLKRGWIFGGTGQNSVAPYPGYPNPALAPAGYIDRGDSLYAIDVLTGKFVWNNQFYNNDVFDINQPVPAGPNDTGPHDADVLAPPNLYSGTDANGQFHDYVADGSKGGLFRAVDRQTGRTVWERQISKRTGLGGIQAGAAYADGVIYVAGFEGIDDGFSDAKFDALGSKYLNAFFATFSPQFWADVENTANDGRVDTGMQTKVYALDAGTGKSIWKFADGTDYVLLKAGASMRHVSLANGLVYVTATSGKLFVLDAKTGRQLYQDQTLDLNAHFGLGLTSPEHASMNGGTVIADGMLYVPYGAQNNPSGGIIAYGLPRGLYAQQ